MSEAVHRKLTTTQYQQIRWAADHDYTIREIASTFQISTKFVNKVLQAEVVFDSSGGVSFVMTNTYTDALHETPAIGSSFNCSTCHRYFNSSGDLSWHGDFYASGMCLTVMPGFVR